MTPGRDLGELTAPELAARRGEWFVLHPPGAEGLPICLAEVTEHPYLPSAAGRRRGFSLVFESDRPSPLPQAIYRVTHPQLGALDLFLVAVGPRDGKMRYEAVFN
jgi:hypothetical protein